MFNCFITFCCIGYELYNVALVLTAFLLRVNVADVKADSLVLYSQLKYRFKIQRSAVTESPYIL